MKKILYMISIILLVLINGCSSKVEETELSFWNVKLGFSEEQIVKKMGNPTTNKTAGDSFFKMKQYLIAPSILCSYSNEKQVRRPVNITAIIDLFFY